MFTILNNLQSRGPHDIMEREGNVLRDLGVYSKNNFGKWCRGQCWYVTRIRLRTFYKSKKYQFHGVTYELSNVRLTVGTSLGIKLDRIHRILLYHPIMHDISVDNNVVGGKRRFGTLFPCGLGYTFFSDTFNDVAVLVRKGFEIYWFVKLASTNAEEDFTRFFQFL